MKFEINLGVGLSTPQILNDKPYDNQVNSGVISPVFGIYPRANWKNFIVETGIESSQTKTKNESRYEYPESQRLTINRTEINRFSIPLTLGYKFKIKNIGVTPMIGLIRNIHNSMNSSTTNIYIVDGASNENKISNPNHYYSNPDEFNKYRLLARLDFNLTDRISIGTSVIFRKSPKYSYIDCCFGDCYYGYNGSVDYTKDVRVFATYQL
jgi:hypothetical protein